jgi:elongator complex protein 3
MMPPDNAGFSEAVIEAVKDGTIRDRDDLQRFKLKLCARMKLPGIPPNSSILADVQPEDRELMEPLLIKKPMRTVSGVAVVAVMTSPAPCPHGRCAYCPGGVDTGSPQAYTGKEPAARRAHRNSFDPYLQVSDRIAQLNAIGHRTDKVDLIIMGGTFTSRDAGYREWFVRRCYDAMNGTDSDDLVTAQTLNETAASRCVGLTIETRPDVFGPEQIDEAMRLGATRVELGVQILDDRVLAGVDRGHGIAEVVESTRACRERGLKVGYHLMPGLPGADPALDLECFRKVFDDPRFRPDLLKIYPTLVVAGTGTHRMWEEGRYRPLGTGEATALLAEMKALVPEYVRIQRIQRDIPVPQIAAGIMKSNIRQLVRERMEADGIACRCIRCREAGHAGAVLQDPELLAIKVQGYEAGGGLERFISLEYGDVLAGYARLRTDDTDTAGVRELKVVGRLTAIGADGGDWQHRGFGRELMARAEELARADGKRRIRVTSGVGVRGYYRELGYRLEAPYMVKDLD